MPIWLCRLLFISHTRSHNIRTHTFSLYIYSILSLYSIFYPPYIYSLLPILYIYMLRTRYNTTVYSVKTNRPDTPRDRRQAWREWKSWRRIAGAILTPAAESAVVKGGSDIGAFKSQLRYIDNHRISGRLRVFIQPYALLLDISCCYSDSGYI